MYLLPLPSVKEFYWSNELSAFFRRLYKELRIMSVPHPPLLLHLQLPAPRATTLPPPLSPCILLPCPLSKRRPTPALVAASARALQLPLSPPSLLQTPPHCCRTTSILAKMLLRCFCWCKDVVSNSSRGGRHAPPHPRALPQRDVIPTAAMVTAVTPPPLRLAPPPPPTTC